MRPLLMALLLCSASSAFAVPSLRLSWDDCSVITPNKSWAGPGTYSLVLSGTGFADPYKHLAVGIFFNPRRVYPAWDFSTIDYWSGPPCQGPAGLTTSVTGGGCSWFPSTARSAVMWEGSLTQPGQTMLELNADLDPAFTPDPAVRYSMMRIDFDHSHSGTGAQAAPSCGYADAPMCIVAVSRSLTTLSNQTEWIAGEVPYVTWQDPTNTQQCPGATPAGAKTWGSIKAQYR